MSEGREFMAKHRFARITSRKAGLIATLIRGRSVKLVFRFSSDQSGVTFLCKVDGAGFRACGAKLARSFKPGKHVVRVKARNSAGLVDPSPAVFRFRVERVS